MKIGKYQYFIPQNVIPYNVKAIGVYKPNGKKVGSFLPQNLRLPRLGEKLYSFGALSDIHVVYSTAAEDFQKALTYLNNDIDVAFTCICGDLTDDGTEAQLAQYKAIVDGYSPDTPVYAISGNHECNETGLVSDIQTYTEKPLYYSFEHGNDVFLMCGCYSYASDGVFTNEYLQWIYETLERNRNKRCFIFEHVFPWNDSGNAKGMYHFDMFSGTKGSVFQSLLRHYKNTVFFHGHSHFKFDLQEVDKKANYNEALGYRSVHIPSLSVPKDIADNSTVYLYAESEGYVVDVYANHIVLRGRDFVKDEFIPIAQYCLNTKIVEIEANTFTDSTGTIVT